MSNQLNYKGYIGFIHYNPINKMYQGSVDNETIITFQGKTIEESKHDFENYVDSDLERERKIPLLIKLAKKLNKLNS